MKNKLLLFLLIPLFLLPLVSATPCSDIDDPSSLLRCMNQKIVEWFGNDPITSNPDALLAYLRIALFITLFTVLFEVMVKLPLFENRRNSAIAVALFASAIGSFFVGNSLYALLLATYSAAIWFVVLAVPPIVLVFITFFLVPSTNRWFIAVRLLLLLLAYYLLNLMIDYSTGLFSTPAIISHGGGRSGGITGIGNPISKLLPIFIPFLPLKRKFNFKKILLPILILILVPAVLAKSNLPDGIETFATWGKLIIFGLMLWVCVQLIKGGDQEKQERKEREEKRRSKKGLPLVERVMNIRKSLEDTSKTITSLGAKTKREEKIVDKDLINTNNLKELAEKLSDEDLDKEDKEALAVKLSSVLNDTILPLDELAEELEPYKDSVNLLLATIREATSQSKEINESRGEAISKNTISPNDLTKIDANIQVINRSISQAKTLLAKIGPNRLNEIKKEFESHKKGFVSAVGKKPKVAAAHLEAMQAAEIKARKLISDLEESEEQVKELSENLEKRLEEILEILTH